MNVNALRRLVARYGTGAISPTKLAWSCALGVYLAFSSFLGIQTLLVFVFSFLLRAQASIVFAVLYLVNNPWTMVPIFFLDYGVGVWFFKFIGVDWVALEPHWMQPVSDFLVAHLLHYVGMDRLGVLPYFVGAHIVAVPLTIGTFFMVRALIVHHREVCASVGGEHCDVR